MTSILFITNTKNHWFPRFCSFYMYIFVSLKKCTWVWMDEFQPLEQISWHHYCCLKNTHGHGWFVHNWFGHNISALSRPKTSKNKKENNIFYKCFWLYLKLPFAVSLPTAVPSKNWFPYLYSVGNKHTSVHVYYTELQGHHVTGVTSVNRNL